MQTSVQGCAIVLPRWLSESEREARFGWSPLGKEIEPSIPTAQWNLHRGLCR